MKDAIIGTIAGVIFASVVAGIGFFWGWVFVKLFIGR